jgi:formate dehydrogenase beta subunit
MNQQPLYHAVLPDVEYYRKLINCMAACPVQTDAGGYVFDIFQGRDERAYDLAQAPNPLATICGRICAHPCETACRRGKIDQPVAIRALKRFVTEQFGVENPRRFQEFLGVIAPREAKEGEGRVRFPEKLAVIGAGPGGLSCAYQLARLGYSVTIFEASQFAGGMVRLGVPEYRLSRDSVELEVRRVLSWGVTLKHGARLGKDFSLKGLREEGFAAIFLAIGAFASRRVDIPGAELDGVVSGLEFLLNINQGYRVSIGERVVVIGGGNVAIDVARTALREGTQGAAGVEEEKAESVLDSKTVTDSVRSALRLGAREVHLVALESKAEMPAQVEEIEDALGEGAFLHPSRGVRRIVGKDGVAVGLELAECLSVFDSEGRFAPKFREGEGEFFPADTIILAIGQTIDRSSFSMDPELKLNPGGTAVVDKQTLATNLPGVFAGGDVAFGPRNVISAIADGNRAAASIHGYLRKAALPQPKAWFTTQGDYLPAKGNERIPRQPVPCLPLNRRTGFREVELGYTAAGARTEAERCLHCHVNTIFDSDKCILCGGCVDVCPEYCLRIVDVSELEPSMDLEALIENRFGPRETDRAVAEPVYAILKDEERCTRCSLCAARCPTDAITMELFTYVPAAQVVHETA